MSNFEHLRKSFHTLGIICPIIYFFIPKYIAVLLILAATAFVVYIDIYRHKYSYIQGLVEYFLRDIIREEEKAQGRLAGASWMFIGFAITCIIFSKPIVIFSWIVLSVCDAAAAVVGSRYGINEIIPGKTFEGSITFFVLSVIIGIFFYMAYPGSYSFRALIIASIAGTVAEIYSKKFQIDDNISIPIAVSLCLSIF